MTDLRSNNEFDSLESFFHERLKDASLSREEGPWKQIEAELERMEKEKRKRRFFWLFFSGIVLLGGIAALWFFVMADQFNTNHNAPKQTSIAQSKKETPSASLQKNEITADENSSSENNIPDVQANHEQNNLTAIENSHRTSSSSEIHSTAKHEKIQLAACRNKANPFIFKKLPFAVTAVEGEDGLTRYFAETEVNDESLQTARSAGFAGAFVKKNFDPSSPAVTVREAGAQQNTSTSYVGKTTRSHTQNETDHPQIASHHAGENHIPIAKENKPSSDATSSIANVAKNQNSVSSTKVQQEPDRSSVPPAQNENNISSTKAESTENKNIPTNSGVIQNNNIKTETPTFDNNNNTNSNGVSAVNPISPPADTSVKEPVIQETKPDTVATIAENKKDSVPQKEEAKDSTKTATNVNPAPFTPEWAIMLLAGPNIFTSQAQSNLYATSGESQPVSLNTELKLQFRPIKLLSFSGGVNYTTYSTKQDRASFRFNKLQTSDYVFYSAFGPMAAPMSTLLQGYSMQAPFDTFPCVYSQNSKLNMINIPIEANLHLLNKSRITVFLGLGVNNSFVLSQQSTLTLHKEHFDNTISYNKVTVSPFSLSLLFSLGCDVRIGKKLFLSFVPSYRYGVTNLSTTSGTTFSPAYFSGNAGLKFKF